MDSPDLPSDVGLATDRTAYWNRQRRELLGWLRKNAPALADLYSGAVDLANCQDTASWPRFVCHAIREFGSQLPAIIVGPAARTKKDADHALGQLAEAWTGVGYPKDGALPGHLFSEDADVPSDASIPVSHHVVRIVSSMVRDYVSGCDSRKDSAAVLFEALAPTGEGDRAELRSLADQWQKIMRWAVKHAHVAIDGGNEIGPDDCLAQFDHFEKILGSLVWGFFTTAGAIDEILDRSNT